MPDFIADLLVERPVFGGRMLGRDAGRVVLVSGAIPGERVRASIEKSSRQMVWARTEEVLEASPDRREPPSDPACGGLSYAHIAYERQCALKGEVLVDAFRRVGKITLDEPPAVAASPERGYRWRARLHVREGRAGFFAEETHRLCDASLSGQLRVETSDAIARVVAGLGAASEMCESVLVAENLEATERVVHLEPREHARLDASGLWKEMPDGITGITTRVGQRIMTLAGRPLIADLAEALTGADSGIPPETSWTRGAGSFFQGNRYLTGALVRHVLRAGWGARVADLYAGVGLFAVAFAASGARVVAVESDTASGQDLDLNAAPWAKRLDVMHTSVEDAAPRLRGDAFDAVVVDPPRTGLSRQAIAAIVSLGAPRIVYVSCDPATLARDAAVLTSSGYTLGAVDAFDLFPNTAHVEAVAVFDRRGLRPE